MEVGYWLAQKTSPNVGLEPTTLRLRVWCSTDWASRALYFGNQNCSLPQWFLPFVFLVCLSKNVMFWWGSVYRLQCWASEDNKSTISNWLYNLSDPSKIRTINSFDGLQTTTRIISQLYLFTSDNRQDTGGSSAPIWTSIEGACLTSDIMMDEVVYFRYLIRYPTWDSNLGPRAP